MNLHELEQALLGDVNSGWTAEFPDLNREQIERLKDVFPGGDAERGAEIDWHLNGAYQSYIRNVLWERGNAKGSDKPRKPLTIIARDMKKLLSACEGFEKRLTALDDLSLSFMQAQFEAAGLQGGDGSPLRPEDLRKDIHNRIDFLVYAARDYESLIRKGPHNISARQAVRSLANLWELHSGRRPSTDKGRGARSDPFLELCKTMTGYVRDVIQEKSVSVGTLSLAGIVSDVLAEMANEDRPSKTREK